MKRIFKVVGLILLIAVGVLAVKVAIETNWNEFFQGGELTNEDLPTFSLLREDSLLIKKEFHSKLKVVRIENSRSRHPVSCFMLNDSVYVIKYVFDNFAGKISDISIDSVSSINQTNGVWYRTVSGQYFKFKFSQRPLSPSQELNVIVNGDSLRTVQKNDSILYFTLVCKKMGITFKATEPTDVFIEGNSRTFWVPHKIPMSVLFISRQSRLVMLVFAPLDPESSVPADVIHKIAI